MLVNLPSLALVLASTICVNSYTVPIPAQGQSEYSGRDITVVANQGKGPYKHDRMVRQAPDRQPGFPRTVKEKFKDPNFKFKCTLMEWGGYMKYVCIDNYEETFFKCFNSPVYYDDHYGELCNEDPMFYQICGVESNQPTDKKDFLLCGDFLCIMHGMYSMLGYHLASFICDGKNECDNTAADEAGCEFVIDDNDSIAMETKLAFPKHYWRLLCDGTCNNVFNDCEDEAVCNGFLYGMYCISTRILTTVLYVDAHKICDHIEYKDCDDGRDEMNCEVTSENIHRSCLARYIEDDTKEIEFRRIPLFNYTSCIIQDIDISPLCIDFMDQTNCSDVARVGVTCQINNYTSTVSKLMLCKGKSPLCDDELENICYPTSGTCFVHKHKMCDGAEDCLDGSDETDVLCRHLTKDQCLRKGHPDPKMLPTQLPIPWLGDSIEDCIDGKDEITGVWPTCGKGITKRFVLDDSDCQEVYLCKDSNIKFVEYHNLCDGVESCGSQNDVCKVSRSFPEISTTVTEQKGDKINTKNLLGCLPGMSKLAFHRQESCEEISFTYPKHQILGLTEKAIAHIKLPVIHKHNCDHMFGESYVYLSCTGSCINSECPLKNAPTSDSCKGQFQQSSVKTYAKDNKGTPYLSLLVRKHDYYQNNFFVCAKSKKCIPHSKVCDLVDDCGDYEDEERCTNHFKCENKVQLIPKPEKCDDIFQCLDSSDECNDQCSKEIIEGSFLKLASWVYGTLAVLFNAINICRCLVKIKNCENARVLNNRVWILMVSTGDFFMGSYLLIVSAYDLYYGDRFCKLQAQWRTSGTCSFLGVVSTSGAFLSMFSMTILSVMRFHDIGSSLLVSPPQVTTKHIIKLSSSVFLVLLASFLLSIVPIFDYFEDFFINGLSYNPSLKLFIGFPDKDKHFSIINSYNGRMKSRLLSWDLIRNLISEMFSQDYKGLKGQVKTVEFYGNKVCFFKYFVTTKDPQRYFVWCVQAIYVACLSTIALCYFSIAAISKKIGGKVGPRFANRRNKTQRKIKIMIITDFLCWCPFIILCVLHSFEVIDATEWYSFVSVLVLPLNSVLNPIFYDAIYKKQLKIVKRACINSIEHMLESFRILLGIEAANLPNKPQDQPEIVLSNQLAININLPMTTSNNCQAETMNNQLGDTAAGI